MWFPFVSNESVRSGSCDRGSLSSADEAQAKVEVSQSEVAKLIRASL